MILVDTSLLGRMTDKLDPRYATTHHAIRKLRSVREQLVTVPQNIFEFWAVATRARIHNGLEMSTDRAALWVGCFRRLFIILPDRPELPEVWLGLVKSNAIRGFKSHDVRFVAAMQTHGILNLAINLLDPAAL
jgi:hypothetical protein